MKLKERQIWRTKLGGRMSVYFVGEDKVAIGPLGRDPLLGKASDYIIYVDHDGKCLDRNYDQSDLVKLLGYEIDLTNREGIQTLGLWLDDCLKLLKTLDKQNADRTIDRVRARLKDICEGYPDGLPLEHR